MTEPCNCEHASHFDDEFTRETWPEFAGTDHAYLSVPADDNYNAAYVGLICESCGTGHLASFMH